MFGEIAARPPGARVVDLMNYACDADLYVALGGGGAARAPRADPERRSTTPAASSSGPHGAGRITHVEGLDTLLAEYGEHVVLVDLLPVGAPRRDWRAVLSATAGSSSGTASCSR